MKKPQFTDCFSNFGLCFKFRREMVTNGKFCNLNIDQHKYWSISIFFWSKIVALIWIYWVGCWPAPSATVTIVSLRNCVGISIFVKRLANWPLPSSIENLSTPSLSFSTHVVCMLRTWMIFHSFSSILTGTAAAVARNSKESFAYYPCHVRIKERRCVSWDDAIFWNGDLKTHNRPFSSLCLQ